MTSNKKPVEPKRYKQKLYEHTASDVLTAKQLAAIGAVAVEWATLEDAMRWHGEMLITDGEWSFLQGANMLFNVVTGNPGGEAMARMLINAIPMRYGNVSPYSDICNVLKRVEGLSKRRNAVVHGTWNITMAGLGLFSLSGKSKDAALNTTYKNRGTVRGGGTYKNEEFKAVADDIAATRLDLNRLMFPLPYPRGSNRNDPLPKWRWMVGEDEDS